MENLDWILQLHMKVVP